MENNDTTKTLSKSSFIMYFTAILEDMGISKERVEEFVDNDIPLGNLGICFDISGVIDNRMTEIFGDLYLGVMPRDTFKAILKYHELEV